jgi:hypothetical protein
MDEKRITVALDAGTHKRMARAAGIMDISLHLALKTACQMYLRKMKHTIEQSAAEINATQPKQGK